MQVFCDQLRFKQILINIQSNALKFTRDNGEVNIVCQYVRAKQAPKPKLFKTANQISLVEDKEHNESADGDPDEQNLRNDRGRLFLDWTDSINDLSIEQASNSEQLIFEEQFSLSQVFKPEEDRDKIVVSVIDSGIGMSVKDKIKLFKLFGTLQAVDQNNNKGIGIGLTICKKLINAYNGRIGLRSKKGTGSQFSFSIPLNKKVVSEFSIPDVKSKLEIQNITSTNQQFDSFNSDPLRLNFSKGIQSLETSQYLKKIKLERKTKQTGKILVVDDEQFNLDIIRMFMEMIDPVNLGESRITYCQDGEKSLNIIKNSI